MLNSRKAIRGGMFLVMLLAVLDLSMRAYFSYGNVEDRLNDYFLGQNISFDSFGVDWNLLQPVVRISRATIGGSHFEKVTLRINTIESILKQRVAVSGLIVGSAKVSLEETEEGWRLLGVSRSGAEFNVTDLFWSIRTVDVTGALNFLGDDVDALIPVRVIRSRGAGLDQRRITLWPDRNCDHCNIVVAVDSIVQPIFDFWTESSITATLKSTGFLLRENNSKLLGIRDSSVELNGVWRSEGSSSVSQLNFAIVSVDPSSPSVFRGRLNLEGEDGYLVGNIKEIEYTSAFGDYLFPPVDVALDVDQSVRLGVQDLDLTEWTGLITDTLSHDHQVRQWLEGLGPSGVLADLRVDIDESGITFLGDILNLGINNYKGVPKTRIRRGSLSGHNRIVSLDILEGPVEVDFSGLFESDWNYESATGAIFFALLDDGYFGVHSRDLVVLNREMLLSGDFALTNPRERAERRLSISLDVSKFDLNRVADYIPKNIPSNIQAWVTNSILSGLVTSGSFMFHGYSKSLVADHPPNFYIDALVEDLVVDYHPEWPLAYGIKGRINIDRKKVAAKLEGVSTRGMHFSSASVLTNNKEKHVNLYFEGQTRLEQLVDFLEDIPSAYQEDLISLDWESQGLLNLNGSLGFSLSGETLLSDEISVELEVIDATIYSANYGIKLQQLFGKLDYKSKLGFFSEGLQGELFGYPMNLKIGSVSEQFQEAIVLTMDGRLGSENIYELINATQGKVLKGSSNFQTKLFIPRNAPVSLEVTSDLFGMDVLLPRPIGKTKEERNEVELNFDFLSEYTVIGLDIDGKTGGWFHIGEGRLQRGSLGIQKEPLVISDSDEQVTVTGRLSEFNLSGQGSFRELPDFELRDLVVDSMYIEPFVINNAIIDGKNDRARMQFSVESDELEGVVEKRESGVWKVHLNRAVLEGANANWNNRSGHKEVSEIEFELPFDFAIDSLTWVDENGNFEDYGEYRFKIRPDEIGIRIEEFSALIKGINVVAEDVIFWDRLSNITSFKGGVSGQNLAQVLPLWGYEVNIDSTSFSSSGEIEWAGSPLDFQFKNIQGEVTTSITNGRFLDVDQGGGAVKLIGLFNYSAIFERMQLNFSDLLGKGMSFNRVYARTMLNRGLLKFVDPMIVEGNSSLIRLTGNVNLNNGILDNEMIVTLPLDKSLPWYAAYVALANPAAGVGVLLARRIFDDQIESLSSGRYSIRGTLSDPVVEFETVFTAEAETSNVAN